MKNWCSIRYLIGIAIFWGCEEIINEEAISEEQVSLMTPSDHAVITETALVLSWELLKGAEYYHLQVTSPSFETPLYLKLDTILVKNSIPITLNTNTYQWRVKAINSAYETAFSTRSFSIDP